MPRSKKNKTKAEDFSADVFFYITAEDEQEVRDILETNIKSTLEENYAND